MPGHRAHEDRGALLRPGPARERMDQRGAERLSPAGPAAADQREAALEMAAIGSGETCTDGVIVEGLGGSAARVQGWTIFSTAIADPHSYRCVITAA